MGVKLRERPGKGWYVLTDYRGQRKAKFFGKDKKQAKLFADKLTARIKWAEQSGEAILLSRPDQAMPTVGTNLHSWSVSPAETPITPQAKPSRAAIRAMRVLLVPISIAHLLG